MNRNPVTRRQRDDQPADKTARTPGDTPWRDDDATIGCPVCGRPFTPAGRARYCCDGCRKTAWRRRQQVLPAPVVVPAPITRRPVTVYQCAACGTRSVGQQRCEDCGAFMARVGLGGACPHCDEPVAVDELLDLSAAETVPPPDRPRQTRPATTTGKGRRRR